MWSAAIRYAVLAAYALALSIWSGNIMLLAGEKWLAGAVPVVGWFYSIAKSDLGSIPFALMVALWLACVAAIVALRVVRKR